MIIALFPNEQKKQSYDLARKIFDFLRTHDVTVVAEDEKADQIGCKKLSSIAPQDIKFMITMGGDGTILRLTSKYSDLDAAIVGINLGNLGFMADVPISDIFPSLQDLIEGKYQVEERMMLETSNGSQSCHAVNDIVVHRSLNYSLVALDVHIDGQYLNTFKADGIVISTPNGSTAYSLSAGGPIICPPIEAIAITPICPHTISNRPIIVGADRTIEIEYISNYDPIEVRADGIDHFNLEKGQKLSIKKSSRVFKLVNLLRQDYFSTLRTKLAWSGKL